MAKVQKMFSLEITPEQYLNNCSDIEREELRLLLMSPRFGGEPEVSSQEDVWTNRLQWPTTEIPDSKTTNN